MNSVSLARTPSLFHSPPHWQKQDPFSFSRVFFYMVFLVCISLPPDTQGRTWTSTDGRNIEAEFVRLEGSDVIAKRNGTNFKIPMSSLTKLDQDWVRAQANTSAPQPDSAGKPEMLLIGPGSTGTVTIKLSVPVGYTGAPLVLISPTGTKKNVKTINQSKLPEYLASLTELNNFIKDLSATEAKENAGKIKEMADKLDDVGSEVGLSSLASLAYVSNLGRIAGAAIAGASAPRKDERSRDEKRADPLMGGEMIANQAEKGERAGWNFAKDQVQECVTMISKLDSKDRFLYAGDSIYTNLPAAKDDLGIWRLMAGDEEIASKEVKAK